MNTLMKNDCAFKRDSGRKESKEKEEQGRYEKGLTFTY